MGNLYNGWDQPPNDADDPIELEVKRAEREQYHDGDGRFIAEIYTHVTLYCPLCGYEIEWKNITRNPLSMDTVNHGDMDLRKRHRHLTWVTTDKLEAWSRENKAPKAPAPGQASKQNPDTTKPPDDRTHNWEWNQVPQAFEDFINKIDGIEKL